MTTVPKNFKKMQLELHLRNEHVNDLKMKVLFVLVRDYYIFFSEEPLYVNMTKFNFYCRPNDEGLITYKLGCYAQCIFNFYTDKTFFKPSHVVPDGFPDSIQVQANQED